MSADKDTKEKLAAIEHERWADWQKWCHSVLRRSGELTEGADEILQRWDKQIATPYSELSEAEKQSDRDQVDRYWSLIEEYIAQQNAALKQKLMEAVGEDEETEETENTNGLEGGFESNYRKVIKNSARRQFREAIQSVFEERV